ncbi:hypothetical protein CKAH01_03897 [Colletotrichum kahawae]|uniref:Ankyrin repeat protein n=1 Tax=Colletotrichum kahawae TaxID=34407 RepID=A0AAD9YQH1_COLKA|nr:hypothetical protein CKAH01_03897 [Colletotrichum kahawae]
MIDEKERTLASRIVKELGGIPLAVEQAGALIQCAKYTFTKFLREYETSPRSLMACASLEDHKEHLELLCLLNLLNQPELLRLALRRLADHSLIQLKEHNGNNRIKDIVPLKILCRSSLESLTSPQKEEFLMLSTYSLAHATLKSKSEVATSDGLVELDEADQWLDRKYFTQLNNSFSLAKAHFDELRRNDDERSSDLDAQFGQFRGLYAFVLQQVAWTYLVQRSTQKAKEHFQESIVYEKARAGQNGETWPHDRKALGILIGFSRACQKLRNFEEAVKALRQAVELSKRLSSGDSKTTQRIISQPGSTARKNIVAATLMNACCEDAEAVVNLLLDQHQLDLDRPDGFGRTFLCMAAAKNRATIVGILLDAGAHIDQHDRSGMTPLARAARRGHEAVVGLLLERNAKVETAGDSSLLVAAAYGHEASVRLLLQKCTNINFKDANGSSPLIMAAGYGYNAVVRLLLDKSAEVDLKDTCKRSALYWAARGGHESVVRLLICKKADLDGPDNDGRTPLTAAIGNKHESVVRLLLENGASVSAAAKDGRTPIFFAAEAGNGTILSQLLEKGAKPNLKAGDSNWTPLFYATHHGHKECTSLLLGRGAKREKMALALAIENDHRDVVSVLVERGMSPTEPDSHGQTAIHLAAKFAAWRTLAFLLDRRS